MAKKSTKKKKQKAGMRKKPTAKSAASVDEKKLDITPHPTAGPKVAEFEQKLDDQLAADETGGTKPKRGRPRKVVEPEPEATPEFIRGALRLPFEMWAISQGVDELALSDTEARQLAEPVKQLLDYYFPKIPVIAFAWCSCAVSIFWIMRTRLIMIQELKKQSAAPSDSAGARTRGREARPPDSPPGFPGLTKPEKL